MASNLSVFDLLRTKFFYIGGFLYLIAAANNIFLYGYLDYSILLPMSSITYIWTMIVAYKLLREKITAKKLAGVAAIIIGVVLLANG
jgi:drug/metabolite transporter (DMT)-like permease